MQDDPFTGPAPERVPLANTPLVWVVAQVRFSSILSVERPDFVAPFQEAIRATYSVSNLEKKRAVIAGSDQVSSDELQIVWRFRDIEDKWQASIAPGFVSLTTRAYESRSDFLDRFRFVLEKFNEHINKHAESPVFRLGLRYIDHVRGGALDKLQSFIRPEMVGIMGTPAEKHVEQFLNQMLVELPDNQDEKLQVRWGKMPAGTTFDPVVVGPSETPSWILDTDMFSTAHRSFNLDQLIGDARRYADSIYRFFRWVVTDEFIRHYGGRL